MSEKNIDEHNRWRSKTVAFRMSPEEADMLDKFVKLSGLTKQEYLIDRALQRDVKVQGNPRVFKALRNELTSLSNELKRITEAGQVSDEFLNVTSMALTILSCMKEESLQARFFSASQSAMHF